ncbi:MAG TPA: cupin domain-containing protein [Candidatus Sulfotelmatobacter sp.]|nr:cupin domain-containing protein [Candidatus Sulfotelmatobacter sp.]
MAQQTAEHCLNPAEEVIHVGQLTIHFLVTGDNSSGSIAVFEVIVPGGARLMAPDHSHDQYEETIYGMEGVMTWTVDGAPIDVCPGQALCIPRGAVHRFDNLRDKNAKALCAITPAAIGPQYFREVAEVLAAASGGRPDKAKMIEIMRRHGLTPAIVESAK